MTGSGREDKRGFKRYRCHSACEIIIDSKVCHGFVVDYSDGFGVITEKSPLLKKDVAANLRILESGEEIKVQVAWIKDMGNDVNIGLKRVGNLKGSLKAFKLPDLLIGMQRGTKTGILEIVSDSIVKRIYIKNGDMIFATSSNEEDQLGEMLLKEGKITIEHFNQASHLLLTTGQKLGKILVDMSCLKPRELYLSVQRQVREIILSLFTYEESSFEFREGPLPGKDLITLVISAANIIYSGMKRIRSFVYLKQMCPSPDDMLVMSQNPMNAFQSLDLLEEDKKILSLIDGNSTLKEILKLAPSDDFESLKTICAFLNIGIIKEKKRGEQPAVLSADDVLDEGFDWTPDEFLDKVAEMHLLCNAADYYYFLGTDKEASDEEIQKAYYRISQQYHPDRHFDFPKHDIKGKLNRISTYATEAHNFLSDSEKRKRYDKTLLQEDPAIIESEKSHLVSYENPVDPGGLQVPELVHDNPESVADDVPLGSDGKIPEESQTRYELGVAYMEMGLVEDALAEFRLSAEDPSKRFICIKEIAAYYANKENYHQAIQELRQLIQDVPSDNEEVLEAKYELAHIHVKNKDYEDALRLYNEIHSCDSGFNNIAGKIEEVTRILSGQQV
jgi:curved DNA-binding protein CbpA